MSERRLNEPLLLGDCPIVVTTLDDAERAADWVVARFWQLLRLQSQEASNGR